MKFPTPYHEALHWIQLNPGTGSSAGLAKLVLSLWNSEAAFSFRECMSNLDQDRSELALRMAIHFVRHGEDMALVEVGHAVCELMPRLWELGSAGDRAKWTLQREWDRLEEKHELDI